LTHRSLTTGAAVVLLALSVSACGGGSDDTGAQSTQTSDSASSSSQPADSAPTSAAASSGPQESASSGPQEAESITATEADFSIALDEDSLAAGAYEIQVANQGRATHDLVVERDGKDVAASDSIGPGESTTLTVTLEPGEYVFYCSIGNHRSMGMEITVQVT
jgi:plastocyanin